MKLTLTTFLSIDGVMQSPGAPTEDPRNGFDLGGWLVPFADMDMGNFVTEWFSHADSFLLGRHTYEIFAAYWPNITDPNDPVASRLNGKPKYVASNSMTAAAWQHTSILNGDLGSAVERLKAQPGDEIQVHGSGRLARNLHDLGLIDEYRLWTFPVVLGKGQRLFSDGSLPTSFTLVDHKSTSTGVSIHSYRSTGPITQGTFAIEDGVEVTR
jgi:dihydrofolate reductase